jgi:hypothetical protein
MEHTAAKKRGSSVLEQGAFSCLLAGYGKYYIFSEKYREKEQRKFVGYSKRFRQSCSRQLEQPPVKRHQSTWFHDDGSEYGSNTWTICLENVQHVSVFIIRLFHEPGNVVFVFLGKK